MIKTNFKVVVSALLLFNGLGAIYGGGSLILHPDGGGIHLSLDWLKHTPFNDYLIPGIILLGANGLLSMWTLVYLVLNRGSYPLLVIVQGVVLLGWIVVQMLLIRTINFLHVTMGSVGMLLIVFGWILKKLNDAR